MTFLELCKKRYSCRKYSDKLLEKEKLDQILAAAQAAPSAHNQQPWKIYVLQGKEWMEKIDGVTPCRYGAGTVLAFAYSKDEEWVNNREEILYPSGQIDVSIMATQAILQAAELDVDSTWVMDFDFEGCKKVLGLPEDEQMVLLMPLGYAAEDCQPAPVHVVRKPLDAFVSYL
ncbi:MAG: nitroreductase [Lachnospiraceae bacterium]|nr:nitroreductase [Lachnospiraceae bacterium]